MSLEELLKRGRKERWREARRKSEIRNFSCDVYADGLPCPAPENGIVFAGHAENSYFGWLIESPGNITYVEGDDAEFRIVAALWTQEIIRNISPRTGHVS